MLVFATISPHPPILLPSVGSKEDRLKVKKTLEGLDSLAKAFKETNSKTILISSPHQDWGFNVPLFFITPEFKGEIKTYLTDDKSPEEHFQEGKRIYQSTISKLQSKTALIASGDLSHCLKADGPYGFHPDGPAFDSALIKCLEGKRIKEILALEEKFPQAAECGLRSISFLLGILEESGLNWEPEILSYEGPFGVGYLVVNFKLSENSSL